MKKKIDAIDTGMIGSIIMLSIHLFWCTLVYFGAAQTVIDYLFWIHFIKPVYQIETFDIFIAIYLLITVSCIGFLAGYIFGKVFNFFATDKEMTGN